MHDQSEPKRTRGAWSTKKRDKAPRGVFRHPSGAWAIRFTCGAGHLHKEQVGRVKSDAVATYHERRGRARAEAGWCPRAEQASKREEARSTQEAQRQALERQVTVRQYAERWLAQHVDPELRERTAMQYRAVFTKHVYPALGDVPLVALRRKQLRDFLGAKRGANLTRGTLKNIMVPLSAMLNAAVDDEIIPGNPAARLFKQKARARTEQEARKVMALSADELARVLRAADEHAADWADMIHALAWTGCRLSEACGLQWQDVDVAGGFLEVRRTASYRQRRVIVAAPKSGKARRVDLPGALVARLRARQSLREAEAVVAGHELSPWIFPAPTDEAKPVNPAFLRYKRWYEVLRRAGLRGVRLHDLRHTYASLLLQAGEPMIYVKEQLGHSSIQVTVDLYGHVRPGTNRAAVDRLAATTSQATEKVAGAALTERASVPTSP